MKKAYSDDLREWVVSAMHSGESCNRVATRVGVALSSVVKWKNLARRSGSAGSAKTGGYRCPILEPYRDWL